jgi:tripartite-type tricarboxylate transporter receptor subunit TctC
MVGDGAGSGNDIFGRIIAQELTKLWGQQVIVDNRPGAAQRIAAEIAAKAPADGYTILHMSATLCANVSLYKDLPYDLIKDFAPVTLLAMTPAVVVVHPSFPAKSIKELIQLAKKKPGLLNYASAGTGSRSFVDAALFVSMARINMVHVPFKGGGQAAGAVVAGEIPVYVPPVIAVISHVNAGRLRALAVTSETRLPLLDVPTVSEAGVPGYASSGWYGLIVPAKTPKKIIDAIHRGVTTVLSKPDIKQKVNELGTIPVANRPNEFGRFINEDIALQAKVFKAAGITAQ